MTQYATDWRAASACLTADPELFFPVAVGKLAASQMSRAQRICAHCPVRRQCFEFAMRTGENHGVWGGTTPDERARERRRLSAARRRAVRSGQAA